MAKEGDIVILKSGGPNMVITYVFKDSEGAREKSAAIKGFKAGDVICEWKHYIDDSNFKTHKETFKAAMLINEDGSPLPSDGGGGDDDDDDDW